MPSFFRLLVIALTVWLTQPVSTRGVGIATSDNFIVVAPEQAQAERILKQAESHRHRIAERWLGKRLLPGNGKTIVHVESSDAAPGQEGHGRDDGTFWAIDHPLRTHHRLWLTHTDDASLDHVLAHEITHLVLTIEHGNRIPAWAGEGLASQEDDADRQQIRQEKLRQLFASGCRADLEQLLTCDRLSCHDQQGYALACALVEHLLNRGDSRRLLAYAEEGNRIGWEAATQRHYGLSLEQLESAWLGSTSSAAQTSLARRESTSPAVPRRRR
jgi:hypothetical protein